MTGRSSTFGSAPNPCDFSVENFGSFAPLSEGITISLNGQRLNLDYVAGAALKQALLDASPASVSIKPAELPGIERDRKWLEAADDLQGVAQSAQVEILRGEELCVGGPGIVTFVEGEKSTVSEVFAETGITGRVRRTGFLKYFVRTDSKPKSGFPSAGAEYELRWGPVVILENPMYFDFLGGSENRGDLVCAPILPDQMPWAQAKFEF